MMKKLIFAFAILFGFQVGETLWAADFNGDGTNDPGVFRSEDGLWAIRGLTRMYFGSLNDVPVGGDYDGNGTDEAAIFRPSAGYWSLRGITKIYLGVNGDNPLTGDYDGDGISDVAVFRGATGLWVIRTMTRFYFGVHSDIPVPGPYHLSGKTDAAVFRGSSGLWSMRDISRKYFGSSSDSPAPHDSDGDGLWEAGIFRSESGLWAISDYTRAYLGRIADVPQRGDYAGEGFSRIGIFRPSLGLWAISGLTRFYFGGNGDIPMGAPRFQSLERSPMPYYGIQIDGAMTDQTALMKIHEAGAGLTKKGYVSWAKMEPADTIPADYRWDLYDQELLLAESAGLTTIVTIADLPAWTSSTKSGPLNLAYLPQFAEFLNALASRYGRAPYNVKHWELFNEPDGTSERYGAGIARWGYYGENYARMLQGAYTAIKAADPAAEVLLGGLAYDWFTDEGGNFYRPFLDDVLDAGGGKYFDTLNFHCYYFHQEAWDSYGPGITGKANYLAGRLSEHGLTKPLICTETGIWGYDIPSYLEQQARFVPQVYVRGLATGLQAVVWFPLSTYVGQYFEGGLLFGDLSPKPAYHAFQVMTVELNGYVYQYGWQPETGVSEAYHFASPATGKTKTVIWRNSPGSSPTYFLADRLKVTDTDGESRVIMDGGSGDLDGSKNGKIWILMTPAPRYVEI